MVVMVLCDSGKGGTLGLDGGGEGRCVGLMKPCSVMSKWAEGCMSEYLSTS